MNTHLLWRRLPVIFLDWSTAPFLVVKQLGRMQSAGFSNASSQVRNDSLSRFSSVTTATPAKRITFYKSGDTQFSGIKMPIHKRSFKCFDALLDDLSQKMPLPFGVRMITTPKGSHTIQSLEQLQDGECYLCSDRHFVKPIDMEAAGKRPVVWHNTYPINTTRKPSRPEEPPTGHSGHRYHRQPKKIVLVKNIDPAVQRSIFLSKKRVHSLRVFMDEISELMQCHVRMLYTLEGQKIDSLQSLMQCPNVLVCVGREPFKHLLLENLRKSSEEKLPGICARSHSSIYTEGHDSKKNVNFGLETKKSIIHPRSDSSNKSTRFSLSSEKSYPNGSSVTPGQLGCVTKEVAMNDDVEKRVLINKDGSMSVEMKVRFRLVNDETLQWSTEIKKLPISTNDCSSIQEGDPRCPTDKVVYSEPESNAEGEAEEACSLKCHQMDFIESYCQNCCNHNKGYDIWKNPLHMNDGISGTRSISNCVGSSERIMHQKASVDSVYTVSRSSEEYTEHVVEKASCFQQTTEEEDARIEYCSRCCSQSEVSTRTTKCHISTDTSEKITGTICDHNDNRKTNYAEFDDLSKVTKVANHLISTNSVKSVIQPLKKEEGDDNDDFSLCGLRASQGVCGQNKPFACVHCYGRQHSQNLHSSPIQHKVTSCPADSLKSKMYKSTYGALEGHQDGLTDTDSMDSSRSSVSKVSSRSQCCSCRQCREAPRSLESDMKSGVKETVQNSIPDYVKVSNKPQTRTNSPRMVISDSGVQKACREETTGGIRSISVTSAMSTVCPCCGGCGRLLSTIPADAHDTQNQVSEENSEDKSLGQRSSKSPGSKRSNKCTHCAPESDSPILNIFENIDPVQEDTAGVEVRHACQCALFDLSNHSAASKQSNKSNQPACGRSSPAEMVSENAGVEDVEDKIENEMSMEPVGSAKTDNGIADKLTTSGPENQIAKENTEKVTHDFDITTKERVSSAMSTKTHSSKDSDESHKSNNMQNTPDKSPPISLASPSPETRKTGQALSKTKSLVTIENGNQALNVKSGHSKASSKSTSSNKNHRSSSRCVQRVATKSPTPASHVQLDEPLSPTLTASVSLGTSAEEQSEDLNERSTTNTSQIFDESRCFSEKYTPEHATLHAVNNSAETGTGERVETAVSTNSTVSDQARLSHCMQTEPESITSMKSKTENKVEVHHLQNDHREPSALSAASGKSQENSTSKNTLTIKRCTHGTQAINRNRHKGETNKALGISGSSKSSQNKIPSGKTTTHGHATSKVQSSTKCKERSPSNLKIKEARKAHSNSATSKVSLKVSKPNKKRSPRNEYVTESNMSQKTCCTILPHSPDPLREKSTDAKTSNTSDKNYVLEEMQPIRSNCKNSSSFKQRTNSTALQNKAENNAEPLMPSCLPNASTTEVVNHWLKNIPIDGPLYQMEDEFCEQHDEILPHIPAVKEEGCFQNETGEQSEETLEMKESQEVGGPKGADPVTEDKNPICDAKRPWNGTLKTVTGDYSHLSPKLTKRESLANNCQSSIQVMKVLLNPKLDRCNSLPEVSPTYGRKLSTSAKGLLDCLANLQAFDPDPQIYDKYSEIISTLQSLWINRPSETVQDKNKTIVNSAEDEFNPRSSSGVDLSSGSIGSGKGSINGGLAKSDTAQGRTTIVAKQKAFPQIQEHAIMGSDCESLTAMPENVNTSIVSSDPITPDIAERDRSSSDHEKLNKEAQKEQGLKATDDVLQTHEPIKDIQGVASTFSQNSRNVRAMADKKTNSPENSKLRTLSDQKGQLTKRISQDPDPVWVLGLLKKLEKQFMSHYANAIAEFKVKWDLNDNEMLDTMIRELKEEVHRRIQSTISRELQKIQSRAGRTPRPPISMLSRDSTIQTEQRRRRLKVMQNKLVTPSRSQEVNTASGTEVSDQRSEDEYCPCDTCMKKKVASRVVQCAEAVSMAPVVEDFDLRKILQTKKNSPVTLPIHSKLDGEKDQTEGSDGSIFQDKNNLKMIKEKVEVMSEHGIHACVNQDKDVRTVSDAGLRTVKEGLAHDEDDGQPEEEEMMDNKIDEADDGEIKTEQDRHKVGGDFEDKNTDKKDEEEDEETESEASEGDTADEDSPDALKPKRKEKESNKTVAGEGTAVEEKESNDEGAEEDVSEGERNKVSETLEDEEDETDRTEEDAETPEEGEESENRTGETAQSAKGAKTFEDESEDAENGNVTSDEQTQDDAPAAAAEAKPRNNATAKIIQGGNTEAMQKSEAKMAPKNSADEKRSDSTEAENEVGKESHENKGNAYTQKATKKKKSISAVGQLVSMEEKEDDQADMDCRTEEKHQTDMRAGSIENHTEAPDNQSPVSGDESHCKLITQITKTSIESQTGSMEHLKDLT